MKNRTSLYTMLTMLVLLGSLSMAKAQDTLSEPPTPPILITPQLHHELMKSNTLLNGTSISSTAALASEMGATAAVVGWNYIHAVNCTVFSDGITSTLYVYAAEGSVWLTTNLSLQNVIAPACQTGNGLAFYVHNTSGNWNQVFTYLYK